jgi:vitamin B12 transporter
MNMARAGKVTRGLRLALFLTPVPACRLAAQTPRDTIPTLEEIVVTADRAPTPYARVASSTTIITGVSLRESGIYFLADALRRVPGVALVPTGSYGGITSLFLRGGESDYTKVLIDGVAVNQAGGGFDFGTLSTDNIERIEIVRGPTSVLYGSDAVTGVVQIFTRQGTGPLRVDAESQAGSFGTWRGQAGVHGGGGQASYSASLSRYRTSGTYPFNSGFASTVGSGALSVHPDPRTDLTLSARIGDNTLHFPTNSAGVPVDSNQQSLQDGTTLGLDFGHRFSDRAEVRVQLASHSQTDVTTNRPDFPADTFGFFDSETQSRNLRQSADLRGLFQMGASVRVAAGVQAEFEQLREFSRSEFNFDTAVVVSADPPFGASRRDIGAYAQSSLDLGARSLVTLGVRLDDNQAFGTHFTARGSLVVALAGALRARGSIGTAFKEPSIRENYANSPFEVGNPDLRPEDATSWEIGLEQGLAGGRVTLAASYFDQRFRHLIQYDPGAMPGAPNYANVAKATSRGIEVVGDMRLTSDISVSASYTWLKTRVVDAGFSTGGGDVFAAGQELIRRPRHSARLDGRVRLLRRMALGLGMSYVGERTDVDFSAFPSQRVRLPDYLTVDLDASVDLLRQRGGQPGVAATIRGENLLDASYQTVVGFRGRRRAILAGARVGL